MKRKNCKDLPKQPSYNNVKAWLMNKGYIDQYLNVLDYKGLTQEGLVEVRKRGLELGLVGQVGVFEQRGKKFIINESYFSMKDLGIVNMETTSPIYEDDSFNEVLEEMDRSFEDYSNNEIVTIFQEDANLSDLLLEESENDTSYSMSTATSSVPPGTTSTPVNFKEWYELRKSLLDKLHDTKKTFLIKKAPKEQLESLNENIQALEEEIESFDPTSIDAIHTHVVNEIELINSILEDIIENSDSINAANLLHNRVQQRLDALETHFSTVFIEGQEGYDTSYNFNRGLSPEEITTVVGKIATLRQKYNKNIEKIVTGVINNTGNMKNLQKHLSPEDFEAYQQAVTEILDPTNVDNNDTSTIRKMNTLGAKSYGDVLTAVLSMERDMAANRESGRNAKYKERLANIWQKIRYKKIGKEYVTDKFFEKDSFGQRTSRLINAYNDKFNRDLKALREYRNIFTTNSGDKARNYSRYMNKMKGTVDFINPAMIASTASELAKHDDFKEYVTSTPAEMKAYEDYMRSMLGDTTFEMELEKQMESMRNFLNDSFKDSYTKYTKNPLRFIQHFYSDNFSTIDESTYSYLIPDSHYIKNVPKVENDEYFNSEYSELEQLLQEDFKEFYTVARELMQYTKDSFDIEKSLGNLNHNLNVNDIVNLSENYKTETARNMGFFGDVYAEFKTTLKEILSKFSDAVFQKNKVNTFKELQLNTHFSSYGRKEFNDVVNLKLNSSHSSLVEEAEGLGLTVPAAYKTDNSVSKLKLAQAIATNKINKNSSLDLHKRILAGVQLAESISTRRSVMGIANLIQDFNKIKERKSEEKFTHTWLQLNVAESGILNTGGKLAKLERAKFLGIKSYTPIEKELKDLLKKELSNPSSDIEYDFNYEGYNYRYDAVEDTYYKYDLNGEDIGIEITPGDIRKAYEEHLKDTLENLGKNLTLGSVGGGLLSNFRSGALGLSPASGLTNREAGYHQNNQAAASGLHGFNTDDLTIARRFLAGARSVNTIEYSPWLANKIGIKNFNRHKQWKTLEYLATNLHLLETMTNDLELGNGVVIQKGALKSFMSDFAVNNAEYHNQMELLVAMMINVKVEKKESDGSITEVPLFDTKTMSFPFDPDTKMLLKDYRTDNNIQNWESFGIESDGSSGNSKFVSKYITLKHKLHGNYATRDKTALESTITGKSAIAFQKWMFEVIENEWGSRKADHVTGEVNVKGRKVVLSEHIPTLLTYIGIQNVFTSNKTLNRIGGIAIGLGGSALLFNPAAVAGTVMLSLLPVVYNKRKAIFNVNNMRKLVSDTFDLVTFQNKDMRDKAVQETILASSFLREILARTIRTSLVSTSRGIVGQQIKESHIRRFSGIEKKDSDGNTVPAYEYKNLSAKDRAIISENAQQVADKMSSMFRYTMIGLAVKAVYLLSNLGDDEEEDEKIIEELKRTEKIMNFVVNKKHQASAELEAMTSPFAMVDNLATRIFYDWVGRNMDDMAALQDYADGKLTAEEATTRAATAVANVTLGVPKVLTNMVVKDRMFYENDRVYETDKLDLLDNFILNSHKPAKVIKEEDVRSTRNIISTNLRKHFKTQLEDTDYTEEEVKYIIDRNMKQVYKAEDLEFSKKTDWESYGEIDYREVIDRHKDVPLDVSRTEPKKYQKSSKSKKSKNKRYD